MQNLRSRAFAMDIKNPVRLSQKLPEIADCHLCTASVSSFTYRKSFGSAANSDELFLPVICSFEFFVICLIFVK